MNNMLSSILELRHTIEEAAFSVSQEGRAKDSHGMLLKCLTILHDIELEASKKMTDQASQNPSCYPDRNVAYTTDIDREIKKIQRRIPRWARNPSQYNSAILRGFLELSATAPQVTVDMLRSHCPQVSDFFGNYNQMKNFGEKNHGKVFEETGGIVSLWEPVKKYILDIYSTGQANTSHRRGF